MIHHMRLNPEPFFAVGMGRKIMEIRLNDEKRKRVKIGDKIVFTRIDDGEQITVDVLARYEFATFRELYEKFQPSICGMRHCNIDERLSDTYATYYTKEQEAEHGVLGIEIRIANPIKPDGECQECKKIQAEITKMPYRSYTWICPNCGKEYPI